MGAGIYLTFMVDVRTETVSLSLKPRSRVSTARLCPLGAIPWGLCRQQNVSLSGPWVCPSMAIPIFYDVMTLKIKKKKKFSHYFGFLCWSTEFYFLDLSSGTLVTVHYSKSERNCLKMLECFNQHMENCPLYDPYLYTFTPPPLSLPPSLMEGSSSFNLRIIPLALWIPHPAHTSWENWLLHKLSLCPSSSAIPQLPSWLLPRNN